jgi:hypothetical protein
MFLSLLRSLAQLRHRTHASAAITTGGTLGAVACALALGGGCSTNGGGFNETPDAGSGSSSSGGFITDSGFGSSDTGQQGPPEEVFGHSGNTLFKLDPKTKAVQTVGTFAGCDDSIIDIAMNERAEIYGVTFSGLYRIDKGNAACTRIGTGSFPNSLSFVPAGTLDPSSEALVGYEGSDYVRIDLATGRKMVVRAKALRSPYESSGDIVSVKGGNTYLTVRGGACTNNDCLVEVDPVTGAVRVEHGVLGYAKVFGLAFWAGSVYGFTDAGELFEVKFGGGSIQTSRINIPGAPSGLAFFGAGSATSAPVIPR